MFRLEYFSLKKTRCFMTIPLFDRLPPQYQEAYNQFFDITSPSKLPDHIGNLNNIVDLAEKIEHVLGHANPIWDTWGSEWGDRYRSLDAHQWHLNQLSLVKQRLAQAIVCKRDYYENTWMGTLAKWILKLFCLWNYGNTAPIRKAEDFLLRYDTRYSVALFPEGYRGLICFWPFITHAWVREHLNLQNFYNYDVTSRAIEVRGGRNEEMPRFMVAVT